jgi:ribonucleotide reductase beta subunit family protein with ferritin-like domain
VILCACFTASSQPLPASRITEIITMAVEIEKEFVQDASPVELIGMNSKTHVPVH